MIRKIILIGLLCYVSYVYGYGENIVDTRYVNRTIIKNNTKIEYIANESICVSTKEEVVEKIKYLPEFFTIVKNLTRSQDNQIKNLRPLRCNNIGCSEGYIQCKYDVFDILGYEHPRFSEKPSTGFDPFFDKIEYVPIKRDEYDRQYVYLNSSDWFIVKGTAAYFYNLTDTYFNASFEDCIFNFNFTNVSINEYPKCVLTNNLTDILLYHV